MGNILQPVSWLPKRVGDNRTYTMDFANFPEIQTGGDTVQSVVSITVTPNDGVLILGAHTVVPPSQVKVVISGGVPTTDYSVVFLVGTTLGSQLEAVGKLSLADL